MSILYNDVITLLGETTCVNAAGDRIKERTEREVFCKVKSVGMRESYQALAVGLKPELVFVLADYYDYEEEKKVKYDGTVYNVLRTFRNGVEIELVVTR